VTPFEIRAELDKAGRRLRALSGKNHRDVYKQTIAGLIKKGVDPESEMIKCLKTAPGEPSEVQGRETKGKTDAKAQRKQICIILPVETLELIDRQAVNECRNRSNMIEVMVEEYLNWTAR